jgi:glycine cleavage system transcriptional repressor
MQKHVSISAMGKDRPGIVAEFSKVLYHLGCNLEETSMLLLRGEFAMILIVALPPSVSMDSLSSAIKQISKHMDLTTSLRELSLAETEHHRIKPDLLYVLSVYGADKPGIVFKVTEHLAQLKINITDLSTRIIESGSTQVYVMILEIELADDKQQDSLPAIMEQLKTELQVDITLNPVEISDF